MSLWNQVDWIGGVRGEARLTLGEGGTPLVRSRNMGPALGMPNLFFKLETVNPTGSYKDRFAAAAVSAMVAAGQTECLATSSGNTGSALAAYCALAGIRCRIVVVESAPGEKLQQMLAYGAELVRVQGFGEDAAVTERTFALLRDASARPGRELQISAYAWSPVGMSGVESISMELAGQALEPIRQVFCPAGGGGLTLAVARGFGRWAERHPRFSLPAVHCVQPEGNDTIATPLRDGQDRARSVECTTRISGLQVANVIDGHEVIRECRTTGGTGHIVSDEAIWEVQKRLAREEGILCEPAGAVALAGAIRACEAGAVPRGANIVCLLTGAGFKDAESIRRINAEVECPVVAVDELEGLIGGGASTQST